VTFFVDANVIVYGALAGGPYRQPCLAVLGAIARGEADGRTSVAVLDEVWHVEASGRAGPIGGLAGWAYALFTPLLPVTDAVVRDALDLDAPGPLGTNDRVHAATCAVHGIDTIVSADAAFGAVADLDRVDPLDAAALRPLLGART
jgi:predicted nucleic acid-binding protein